MATFIEQLTQGKSPPRVDVLAEDNEEDDAGEEDANNEWEDAGEEDAGEEDAGEEDAGAEDAGEEGAGTEYYTEVHLHCFLRSVIRHDSSLSKYRKQKQSPPWTFAIFSISRGGLLLFTVLAE